MDQKALAQLDAALGSLTPVVGDFLTLPDLLRAIQRELDLSMLEGLQVEDAARALLFETALSPGPVVPSRLGDPTYPLRAAKHLFGLGEYPTDLNEVVPDTDVTLARAFRVAKGMKPGELVEPFDPRDSGMFGVRSILAARAGRYGSDRTVLSPRSARRKEVVRALAEELGRVAAQPDLHARLRRRAEWIVAQAGPRSRSLNLELYEGEPTTGAVKGARADRDLVDECFDLCVQWMFLLTRNPMRFMVQRDEDYFRSLHTYARIVRKVLIHPEWFDNAEQWPFLTFPSDEGSRRYFADEKKYSLEYLDGGYFSVGGPLLDLIGRSGVGVVLAAEKLAQGDDYVFAAQLPSLPGGRAVMRAYGRGLSDCVRSSLRRHPSCPVHGAYRWLADTCKRLYGREVRPFHPPTTRWKDGKPVFD